MKITSFTERLGYMGKSTSDKQKMLSIGEVYSIWKLLVMRYDALISTKTYLDLVKDSDLKKVIRDGIEVLETQIDVLERLTKEFSIPMPDRPPKDSNIVLDVNAVTDKFVYRAIFDSMSNMMFKHISNYQRANSSYLRDIFRRFLNQELDLYDGLYEYGKLKSYLQEVPSFRV